MRGEVCQFVKTDKRDLAALPLVHGAVELQMREFDFATARPAPFAGSDIWRSAHSWIKLHALVPEAPGIGDLGRRPPEKHRTKFWDAANMAQRF